MRSGVDGAGFDEGEGAAGGADVPLAAEVAADDAAALDDLGAEGQVLLLVLADEVEGAALGEHFHALPEGPGAGGSADGVDDQVRADAFGMAPDGGDGVFVGGVDDVVGAEFGGKLAAERGGVDGDEAAGVDGAHDLEDEAADEALAEDDDDVAGLERGDVGPAHGGGAEHPVGGLVPGDAGGEREDFGQLGLALGDGGADDVLGVGRDGADAVADGEVLHALTEGIHHAGHGVAHDLGIDGFFEDVASTDFGAAADEAADGFDADFAVAGFGDGGVFQDHVAPACGLGHAFHVASCGRRTE